MTDQLDMNEGDTIYVIHGKCFPNSSLAEGDFINLTGGAAGSFDVLSTEQCWCQSAGISLSVLPPEGY